MILRPAEYAALTAVLIPILAVTSGYWTLHLRKSFGSVARFIELEADIEDAEEGLNRLMYLCSERDENIMDVEPSAEELSAEP